MVSKIFSLFTSIIFTISVVEASYYKCAYSGIVTTAPVSVSSDALSSGRNVSGSLERSHPLPSWIDFAKIRKGQRLASANLLGLTSVGFGLIAYLMVPDISNVLLYLNTTTTPEQVNRRYVAKLAQLYVWYNVQNENEGKWLNPEPNGVTCSFCASLYNVRQLHVSAMNRVPEPSPFYNQSAFASWPIDEELWDTFNADLQASNISEEYRSYSAHYESYNNKSVPINQFAMAITQFAFAGYLVLNPESVHIYNASDEDIEGFVHLWAVIGYALGIDDEYNICLKPSLAEVRTHFREIHEKYFLPSLFNLNHDRKVLIQAWITGGLSADFAMLSERQVLMWYLRDYIRVPVQNLEASLSLTQQISEYTYAKILQMAKLPHANLFFTRLFFIPLIELGVLDYYSYPNFTASYWAQYIFYNGTSGVNIDRLNCPASKTTTIPSLYLALLGRI